MTKFVGRRGSLGVAVETVRGTPRTPVYWFPDAVMSFFDRTVTQRESQGMGNIADSDSMYVTLRMGEGNLEAEVYDNGLGFILASLLGALPSTAGSYTHTYTLSQTNQQASLSLYWKDPNSSWMFPLAVVESLQIKVEPEGMVEYTIAFKSKAARKWTELTPVYTALGSKFLHQHVKNKLADDISGLGAASEISLKGLDLTFNRNSTFDSVIGTVEPEDVLGQHLSVEGTITLNNESETYHDYMVNGTYKSWELRLERSATSKLTFQFPRVDFSEWQPDYTLNEISKQQINVKANYDAANALDIISTATLINSFASYA